MPFQKGNLHGRWNQTHGMHSSPEYNCWAGVKQRCLNPKNHRYNEYGGRGITICERWMKFENFLADMGRRPKGTSLDRIDNDGNYELSNCKWSTAKEQINNRCIRRIENFSDGIIKQEYLKRFPETEYGMSAC